MVLILFCFSLVQFIDLRVEFCGDKPEVLCQSDESVSDSITGSCKYKNKILDEIENERKIEEGRQISFIL